MGRDSPHDGRFFECARAVSVIANPFVLGLMAKREEA
jgi:hypothetical protein